MNGYNVNTDLDEEYDDESYDDDEAYRSTEFGLGDILSGVGSAVSGVASGIGSTIGGLGGAVGSLLGGGPKRPSLPQVQVPAHGPGVSSATLQTPAGMANLRLPAPVPTREEFLQTMDRLEGAINAVTTRVNSTQKDLSDLGTKVGAVVVDTRKDLDKFKIDTRRMLAKSQHVQNARIAKMRKEIDSKQMTYLLVSMMQQQQLQAQLDDHTHSGVTTGTALTGPASTSGSGSNLSFLPLMMMMGSSDGGSGDSMMPMMMMMMFAGQR